ncbi:flavin reductase [bacterium]|nr:flavin reductase [bacterium]
MERFEIIKPKKIKENVFDLIGNKWMLITAGNKENFNTMTASWGGFGRLWNKNVATIYVRPTRYTYRFLEEEPSFTLSFFQKEHKDILKFCGSHSGRDHNKIKETGLTPLFIQDNLVGFKESYLIISCKKIYFDDLDPKNFLDKRINNEYENDYHRIYIGEILNCYLKKINN